MLVEWCDFLVLYSFVGSLVLLYFVKTNMKLHFVASWLNCNINQKIFLVFCSGSVGLWQMDEVPHTQPGGTPALTTSEPAPAAALQVYFPSGIFISSPCHIHWLWTFKSESCFHLPSLLFHFCGPRRKGKLGCRLLSVPRGRGTMMGFPAGVRTGLASSRTWSNAATRGTVDTLKIRLQNSRWGGAVPQAELPDWRDKGVNKRRWRVVAVRLEPGIRFSCGSELLSDKLPFSCFSIGIKLRARWASPPIRQAGAPRIVFVIAEMKWPVRSVSPLPEPGIVFYLRNLCRD